MKTLVNLDYTGAFKLPLLICTSFKKHNNGFFLIAKRKTLRYQEALDSGG